MLTAGGWSPHERLPRLALLAAAWLAGIALVDACEDRCAGSLGGSLVRPAALAAVTSAVAVLIGWHRARSRRGIRGHPWAGTGVAVLVAAFLGAARMMAAAPDLAPPHVASWIGYSAQIEGRVADEPWVRDNRAQYRVDVTSLTPAGASVGHGAPDAATSPGSVRRGARGRILVQAPAFPAIGYGERVRMIGPIDAPPELTGFDYGAYLARKDIYALVRPRHVERLGPGPRNAIRGALLALKGRARRALAVSIPEPEASLATGILLGDARGIPEAVDQAFQDTNTTHVIAISGSNVALVVAVATAALSPRLGRRRAVPAVLLLLGAYTALVGADAAVVRASVMGCVALIGIAAGRPSEALAALSAAALAMTAYRPSVLWDLGFQLSCAATLGLILFQPAVAAALGRLPRVGRRFASGGLVAEGVSVTLAAQVTTWPIVAHHMGQVSFSGLVANFLIVPAQPPVMALSGVTAVLGAVWPPAGTAAGTLAWLPLAYTIRVVEVLAAAPGATVSVALGPVGVAAYFCALAVLTFAPPASWRARAWAIVPTSRRPGARALACAAAAASLAWVGALTAPDGYLHVRALDVGQGDAILIETPTGRRVLVDAGPGDRAVLDGLGRQGPPWARRLDGVVVTHRDADHVGGMAAVIQRHGVTFAADNGSTGEAPEAVAYEAALLATGTERVTVKAGARIVLDAEAGVAADVLWPPKTGERGTGEQVPDLSAPGTSGAHSPNDASVVLLLRYGEIRMLLTGDIEAPAEEALVAQSAPISAHVLKVAHHGSSTSTTPAFLRRVAPAAAVINVGADNRYGHPTQQVLNALAGIPVWRTDRHGAVDFITDGRSLWVRSERGRR